MKNVIIASLLLLLAIGFTVVNALWVDARIDLLLELGTQDRVEEAVEEFRRAEPYLAFTVHEKLLDETKIALQKMQAYKDILPEDYQAAKALFISFLEKIACGEKFSLSNVF